VSIKRYTTIFAVILLAACGKSPITAGQLAKTDQQSVMEAEAVMLVFEFPDGARGGHGKIQGTAPPQIDNVTSDYLLNQIRMCGALNVRENGIGDIIITSSHRYWIYSDSTPNDMAVVRCVQKSISRHFSAYVAATAGRSDERFEELWTAQNRPKNRRN
jgi:hypothetical protein